jgi:hypothetical protein
MSQRPNAPQDLEIQVRHLRFDGPDGIAQLTDETMDLPAGVLGELIEMLNATLARYNSRAVLPLDGPSSMLRISRLPGKQEIGDETWQQVVTDLLGYIEPAPEEPQIEVDAKDSKSDGKQKPKKRNRRGKKNRKSGKQDKSTDKTTKVLDGTSDKLGRSKPKLDKVGYGVNVGPDGKFASPSDDEQSSSLSGQDTLGAFGGLILSAIQSWHVRVTHTTVEINPR